MSTAGRLPARCLNNKCIRNTVRHAYAAQIAEDGLASIAAHLTIPWLIGTRHCISPLNARLFVAHLRSCRGAPPLLHPAPNRRHHQNPTPLAAPLHRSLPSQPTLRHHHPCRRRLPRLPCRPAPLSAARHPQQQLPQTVLARPCAAPPSQSRAAAAMRGIVKLSGAHNRAVS